MDAKPEKDVARASELSPVAKFFKSTELDTRMLGMIFIMFVFWLVFDLLSDGLFLTPRNLWNLSVQTASVSIMATGMVMVIVTRNIDLSVGSILGFVGMIMAVTQAEILPDLIGYDHSMTWLIALLVGLLFGILIGGFHGVCVAYLGIPSFIVTLGGLLVWRGGAWWITSGRTVAPMDKIFRLMGGGTDGSIGATASWIIGLIACAGIIAMIVVGRSQRKRFNFPLRPLWAEGFLVLLYCSTVLGAVAIANAYPWPERVAANYAEEHGITVPEGGLFISTGIAIPVLIAIVIGIIMTFVSTRTKFGRYIFAQGGNPEAAELAGINTKWVTVKIFMVMGALCAIAGSISTARLNAATNAQGTLDELLVIAAAVIGGTSLSGGMGTIGGAMMGAIFMQSIQSGMILLGVDTPLQNIAVGVVLVVAVWLDTVYRRKTAKL